MTIIDQIKAELLKARKARDSAASASLSTLLGEIETLAKAGKGELNDAVVVTVVKKFIKNLDETIGVVAKGAQAPGLTAEYTQLNALNSERKLYEQFLPKQLSVQEVEALIDGMIASGAKDVGDCMKLLKTNHAGTYDGSQAAAILKAKFAK